MKSTSRYLFLQGQISPFFAELGQALHRRGHPVHRIHFNGGDRQFWSLPGAVDFRGRPDQWPEFFKARLRDWQITDVVLFSDCRPLHAAAIRIAVPLGVRVQVFEEGYLRPDYITLEPGGVNGHSSLPRDAASYLRLAATLPELPAPSSIPASFARRAREDFLYHLSSLASAARFPHHHSHRPWHPLREYAIGAYRLPMKAALRAKTEQRIRALVDGAQPYFLFPLQLAADSQIRFHAPGDLPTLIRRSIESFARHAPAESLLVLTEHPLDYGPVDLAKTVRDAATAAGVAGRTLFLRGGSPPELIAKARGLITVNSTIGITALAAGVPVIALGTAIYDLPGLSCQQGLDAYWSAPSRPDPQLFDAFRRVVTAQTQINGGFFSAEGIAQAVEGALVRLPAGAEIHASAASLSHRAEVHRLARPPETGFDTATTPDCAEAA
ncbi:MAG: capsular biosynthesis protein [Stagnimonas sp.]|nr:capsular biosynthesis protein [Stagnimonas sp.]